MVHETIEGTFRQTNLTNESPEYLGMKVARLVLTMSGHSEAWRMSAPGF